MSWYPKTKLNTEEFKYLQLIQSIWKVKRGRKLVPYILEPHQIEWHRDDVAIQLENAKTRVVVKSRNTSFTTSSIISSLMAVPVFPGVTIPFIRMNMTRAKDLIKETKEMIKNMTPIRMENGTLFPFNPEEVDTSNSASITFPNGTEIRAFPATNASAENIRGLRIVGSAGIIDEALYMKDFYNIYIALRDANSGVDDEGLNIYQMNIGTTIRSGSTPFMLWFMKLEKQESSLEDIKIYRWPVFEPTKFQHNVLLKEQNLVPIVRWHSIDGLQQKLNQDLQRFLEEYMAEKGDDTASFYTMSQVLECVDEKLLDDMSVEPDVYIGIDPASFSDYFGIGVFRKTETEFRQKFLFYKKGVELPYMEEYCKALIRRLQPKKVRMDGNGLGVQLSQALEKEFGKVVETIRGNISVVSNKISVPFNEYLHTNQKQLIVEKRVKLINDELQLIHYGMWNYSYKAERDDEYGHGDTTIANGLALLPDNWRRGGVKSQFVIGRMHETKEKVESTFDRFQFYKKQMKRKMLKT